MHIQVIAPNVDTKFTNQPNTLALLDETLRNTRAQNAVHRKRAGYGTPMRLTRAKIFGAWPWTARPYRVRVPMYKSEFAAERTKMRIAALMIWFRTLIPASVVAVGAARKRTYGHGHDIERTHDERRGSRSRPRPVCNEESLWQGTSAVVRDRHYDVHLLGLYWARSS